MIKIITEYVELEGKVSKHQMYFCPPLLPGGQVLINGTGLP